MNRAVAAPAPAEALTSAAVLVLRGVTRAHGGRAVWQPLDLQVDAGTVTVVTGANGSGKTTLLRVAAGLLRLSSGTRSCAGTALYVRAGAGLRSAQTVADAVIGTARLAGRHGPADDVLTLLGLDALRNRRLGTLSAGERVRATLAAAVAVQPALLCLDEPTGALDRTGRQSLVRVVEHLRCSGTAMLIATHQPEELLRVADAHLSLLDGTLVAT